MKYIALLRGINVGGNSKVEMSKLKSLFEGLCFKDIKTYINSGNVIFSSDLKDTKELCSMVEKGIEKKFKLSVPVLMISEVKLKEIVEQIPESWQNNSGMKCDVMFLWEEIDSPKTLDLLSLNKDLEDFKYVPGAIIWRIDRDKVTKSKVLKTVGTDIYKKMTIRNCNTARKLLSLINS